MKFFSRSAAVLAAAALFPIAVMAQEPQGAPPPQGGRGGMRAMAPQRQPPGPGRGQMASRPQLTDQQREQIRAFDEQHRQTLETTRRDIGDLNRQLNEALTAEKLDNGRINTLRASIVQKETALAQARLDRMSKLSSILTAEQRQSLRGRALGEILGPGGAGGGRGGAMGRPGGRGGAMAVPQGRMGGRGGQGAIMQRRQQPGGRGGIAPQLQQRRGLRGGGAGAPAFRGRGGVFAAPGGAAGDVARLRAEIRRLEAQLEMLRRRIR